MTLKINKQFGLYAVVAAGAVAAALYQTSAPAKDTSLKTEKDSSTFMHGDLFLGCAAHTLRTAPGNDGALKIGDDTVSVGQESITRLGGKDFAVAARTSEGVSNITNGFKECLVEQTARPDISILRTVRMP